MPSIDPRPKGISSRIRKAEEERAKEERAKQDAMMSRQQPQKAQNLSNYYELRIVHDHVSSSLCLDLLASLDSS